MTVLPNEIKKSKREWIAVLTGGLLLIVVSLSGRVDAIALWIGYILGLLPVALYFLQIRMIRKLTDKKFMIYFYSGTFLKLLFVLTVYGSLLSLTKIEQFPFTLSFIISYIFHSVIDIILIHKTYV